MGIGEETLFGLEEREPLISIFNENFHWK